MYPSIEPFDQGKLSVSEVHTLHYEQVGNSAGECALFLHGGPGIGIRPDYRRFFDPNFFRTVLIDQRGAGRSTPNADLSENTTWDLVEDLEKLRIHLGIERWVIMGGSWGSLLCICYAILYPERVSGMILRGVFLGTPQEHTWLYEGEGTAKLFPEHWHRFRSLVSNSSISGTVNAYYSLLNNTNADVSLRAARSWAEWSTATMTLLPDLQAVAEIVDDNTVLPAARIECHYVVNEFFLPTPNYVIENASRLKEIPCYIIHGRYDAICPAASAWELHKALPGSNLNFVADGGHSPMEPSMASALISATEQLKRII